MSGKLNGLQPDLIDDLAVAFEQGAIALPAKELCAVMVNELEEYAFSKTPAGYTKMGAPEGGHDDCVISLALAWRHAKGGDWASAVASKEQLEAMMGRPAGQPAVW